MSFGNNRFGGNRGSGGGNGGGFRRNSNFGGPRQMFDITCSECGKAGQVPFKPRSGAPVFCRDCFAKKSGRGPRNEGSGENNENSEEM